MELNPRLCYCSCVVVHVSLFSVVASFFGVVFVVCDCWLGFWVVVEWFGGGGWFWCFWVDELFY